MDVLESRVPLCRRKGDGQWGAGPACRRDAGLTPAKGEEAARVSESTAASGKFQPGQRDIPEPKSPLESAPPLQEGAWVRTLLSHCLGGALAVTLVSETRPTPNAGEDHRIGARPLVAPRPRQTSRAPHWAHSSAQQGPGASVPPSGPGLVPYWARVTRGPRSPARSTSGKPPSPGPH